MLVWNHPTIEVVVSERGNGTREKPTLVTLCLTFPYQDINPAEIVLTEEEAIWIAEQIEAL